MVAIRGVVCVVLAGSLPSACGDNDVVGGDALLVTPTTELHTTESGGTATVMVTLAAPPDQATTVSIASSNTDEGVVTPPALTFTPERHDIPQPVTIVGVDDNVVDGAQAFTVHVTAGALGAVDLDVTNDDDDVAGVVVTPAGGLMTTEAGGPATFTVALTARPAADVTIPLASSDLTEGTVDRDALTFTAGDWDAPQPVTIVGVADDVADGPIAYTIVLSPCQSGDPQFAGVEPDDVAVTNVDDDSPGFVVTPASGLHTTEAGGSDVFTVALTSQPAADVAVAVASNDPTEAAASTAMLTFTPTTWDVPQTVTVTGIDDATGDGDQAYAIVLGPAASGDAGYDGVDPDDVAGVNLDDDVAGFAITPTTGLHTTEAGGVDTFAIALLDQPAADVTVTLASSDPTEGVVFPTTVTFTAATWDQPRTVIVRGVDDHVADGDQGFAIVTAAATSADPAYSGIDPPDVSVTNLDDETPNVLVQSRPHPATSENGRQVTLRVRLTVAPTAPVTCTVHSADPTEGTVNPVSLTFTPASVTTRRVVVTGVDDPVADGDQLYTVVFAACTSADPAYDGLDPIDVVVVNRDND